MKKVTRRKAVKQETAREAVSSEQKKAGIPEWLKTSLDRYRTEQTVVRLMNEEALLHHEDGIQVFRTA